MNKIASAVKTEFITGERVKSELNFSNPLETLVSVMLSAQCTDKRVNMVTPVLFAKYKTASDYANAKLDDVEQIIKSVNYYHNKAKNLIEMGKHLAKHHEGQVPSSLEDLVKIPGCGRKTAQVVLIEAFDIPAFPVDTHIFRVSNRLGLTDAKNVIESEQQLKSIFSKEDWGNLHRALVLHGRYVCKAVKPDCENCKFRSICKSK